MNLPPSAQSAHAVHAAQQMFARTLSAWAMDVLELRRAGLGDAAWNNAQRQQRWSKAA